MQYRRVGKWGLKLPEISLGLWQNFGGTAPLELSREIVRRASGSRLRSAPCRGSLAVSGLQTRFGTLPLKVKTKRLALCPKSAVGSNMHGQPEAARRRPWRYRQTSVMPTRLGWRCGLPRSKRGT
jgi:hypothetical protein